jgi:uncharacterized protein YggE
MTHPDTISLQVTETKAINADRVDLFVTITGRTLVTGQAALSKAIEVRQLAQSLQTIGIDESYIFLEGVSASVETGLITKSSTATYQLRIHCQNIDQLADLLGVITSQKNTKLTTMTWGYSDLEQIYDHLLEQGLIKLQHKAAKIAATLGVNLLGIYELTQQIDDPERQALNHPSYAVDGFSRSRTQRLTAEDLGLEVSHQKKITIVIAAQYRVSPLG